MIPTAKLFDQPDQQVVWDDLVSSMPGGHVLQCWAWGELKARFGWAVQRVAAGDACAQVLYRTVPGGLGTIAYIPKGPLVNYEDPESLRTLLAAIEPLARQRRAFCLKIEPDLEDDPALNERLLDLGFRPSPQPVQPRSTILVDLVPEPDQILAGMKQKTRYNVRLAARKEVTVRPGTEADLPTFYRLMESTAERDGFGIHTEAYYETAYRLFMPLGRACLLLAEYESELLAGLAAFALETAQGGTACYMYGASSEQHRNLMPTYLLQWEAMLWAREKGCRTYDLWGVPDREEEVLEAEFAQRSDGLWGVYRFKRGFGGRLVRTTGAWDLVYAPWRYRLYSAAVRLRSWGV